jgi:DUF177 domain-containing protein
VANPRKPLRLNVGFLVNSPIGVSRNFDFEDSRMQVDEDLMLSDFAGIAKISRTPQGLLVQADFQGTFPLECVRCLINFSKHMRWDFTELYAFKRENVTDSGLMMPEDAHIDLAPLVREYALLEIPINPVCKPDCKGLCSVCGENRNEVDCGHGTKSGDTPFSSLGELLK